MRSNQNPPRRSSKQLGEIASQKNERWPKEWSISSARRVDPNKCSKVLDKTLHRIAECITYEEAPRGKASHEPMSSSQVSGLNAENPDAG